MIKLWMEWDYGQDDVIFKCEEHAKKWIEQNVDLSDFDPPFTSVQDIFDAGLAGFKLLGVWKP